MKRWRQQDTGSRMGEVKNPFEARLGDIRIHHFAHSGEGCDEVSAYLMGLYGFLKDFILGHRCIIPELTIYYSVKREYFDPKQFR